MSQSQTTVFVGQWMVRDSLPRLVCGATQSFGTGVDTHTHTHTLRSMLARAVSVDEVPDSVTEYLAVPNYGRA